MAKFCCRTAPEFYILLHTDTMVAVEYHKTLLGILSKQMNLLHVAQGSDILGNRGLKCEHRGGIMMNVYERPAEDSRILSLIKI